MRYNGIWYAGYKVVLQGDGAGPHRDATYLKEVKDYCEKNGWRWITQAAQTISRNSSVVTYGYIGIFGKASCLRSIGKDYRENNLSKYFERYSPLDAQQ